MVSDTEQRRNTPASTPLLPSVLPRTGIIELLLCPRTRYRICDDKADTTLMQALAARPRASCAAQKLDHVAGLSVLPAQLVR
jgi:hypothetical protein